MAEQMSKFREMSGWIAIHGHSFEPGRWYFQRKPVLRRYTE